MSDSESEDQQRIIAQRKLYTRRYRKRTRDQAFQRRQSASSSNSEHESVKRSHNDSASERERQNDDDEVDPPLDIDQSVNRSSHDSASERERQNDDDEVDPPLDIDQSVNRSSHDSASERERQNDDDEVDPPLDIDREMLHFGGRDDRDEQEREEEEQEVQEGDIREEEQDQEVEERERESKNGSESEQESNAESSEEEEIFDVNDNEPLFEGAHITLKQSALAILSFALCHKLSQACINDLLSLISLHCGPNNFCLKSVHLFKKYFSMLKQDHVIRHYYCSVCEVSVPSKDSLCPSCSAHNQDENGDVDDPGNETDKNEIQYFIEFSMSKQIQSLYKRPGFFESLQFKLNRVKKNVHNLEDIYDGQIYSELVQEGFLANPCNISFTMYFDGVSLFKSSKFTIWPLFLSINELKYKERTETGNIIIAGLWFGKNKPNPNLFLKPIWDKMQVLQNQGIQCKLPNAQFIIVKGRVVAAVGDLPAKALFMRLIQFNGLFSCFNCMSSGARFGTGPRNSVQVFPYSRNLRLRSNVEMLDFADQAVIAKQTDPKATIYGVKGPTLLSAFLPDLVRSMGIDDLHGIFSGLMKALLEFWFHCEGDFSISDLVDLVDERLVKIRPPFHFQRVPRSIKKELGLFKGSDYKMMFFFFSIPVLYGILPAPYWEHHCKLVSAVSLLSQDSVSPEQIQAADSLLNIYVSDFQHLYGVRHLGLNVHQLLHLSMVVKNLGPLWVYSCFTYESLNGQLASLVHGTRYAALQICASTFVCLNHSFMIDSMEDSAAKRLCLKLMERGRKKVKVSEIIDNKTSVVDGYKVCRVPQWIWRLLENDLNVRGGRVKFFLRLKKKGNVYCSEKYVRSKRKLSCFAEGFYNDVPHLCKIKYFIRWSPCDQNCSVNCVQCPKRFFSIVETYDRIPWRLHQLGQNITIPHLNKVHPSGTFSAFPIESIRNACLYISINGDDYMCTPVNSLEVE